MAEILLFHHAQGQTKGFHELADRLREPGHAVHAPDLYDGRTFDDLEGGVGHARELGFGALVERATAAAEGLPAELVYAGLSLGVMPAQQLAQTRPGALGAVLLHACLPSSEFGGWPAGVPVQVHGMDADPEFADAGDLDAAKALVEEADDAELFVYPGDGHLFTDSSLKDYDAAATDLLVERVLGFLARR
ncbi:MAG TPA: dienelactone hydrolase family protein [Actinomycetes bacterium]|nr:dienelactone hydrolase family protein [Actinomycetes bacterium]